MSKSYGPRVLFDHISFHIDEGDKIALVAPNGTGKTSLLSIIAGRDSSDGDGSVHFLRDITVAFLEQDQHYDPDRTISEIVMEGAGDQAVPEYEVASVLSRLKLDDPFRKAGTLSGGEAKRTAIAAVLIRKPDFLVLDEPTNHLDVDSIEFLEDYLTRSRWSPMTAISWTGSATRFWNWTAENSTATRATIPTSWRRGRSA